MNIKKYLLASFAFIVVGFILAMLWHMVLFGSMYQRVSYISDQNQVFALGFVAMFVEAFIFVYVFGRFKKGKNSLKEGIIFGLLIYTLLIGNVSVIAHAAKHDVGNIVLWFVLEGAYFVVAGVILGAVVGLIYGRNDT